MLKKQNNSLRNKIEGFQSNEETLKKEIQKLKSRMLTRPIIKKSNSDCGTQTDGVTSFPSKPTKSLKGNFLFTQCNFILVKIMTWEQLQQLPGDEIEA